ncbi:hypothetical protein GCK72_001833 [Caenorhabditis remanei]|uniref:Uncharacterized protein n=1 Tax=Caenorhabditis remanei TaxID=31234 RepID=A0A6A5HTD7_CAERE|nr:hypothetical protein GCK72_001833 [Caenorhabditis remanei]KAF1770016.1 hypothetical protein GCK72_001833 [Caenorhabditis remanei]
MVSKEKEMNLVPTRPHSRTRLEYRSNGISIYYRRANDGVEEEMMRLRVIKDENQIDDSLRSSKSSPPESSSSITIPLESSNKKMKMKMKKKKKSTSSKHKKRRTSRPFNVSKKWNKKKKKEEKIDWMDEDTIRILNELQILNHKIRKRFQVGTICPSAAQRSNFSITSISSSSFPSISASKSSKSTRNSSKKDKSISPVGTAEAFDYCGRPIKYPFYANSFPGAQPVQPEKKPKEVLLMRSKKETQNDDYSKNPDPSDFLKPPVPPVSSSSSFSTSFSNSSESEYKPNSQKLTRVSSDTKFPNARSPATREKLRLMVKECILKKIIRESGNENLDKFTGRLKRLRTEIDGIEKKKEEKKMEKEKKEVEEEEEENSCSSLKTIYSKSMNSMGCDSCNSCVECIISCTEEHSEKSKNPKKKKNKKKNKNKSKKSFRSSSTSTAYKSFESSKSSGKRVKKLMKRQLF